MLNRLNSRAFLKLNTTKICRFHISHQRLSSNGSTTQPKKNIKDIKDWDDLMKLDSFEGIPTSQLESIMKKKSMKLQYSMDPAKPLKTESELELEYMKELKKAEEAQRNEQWTLFKARYKWSFVNWILCILIGYYMAKAVSLEINYHINEGIYKERLNKKIQEFEEFKESHLLDKKEDQVVESGRRKWFGLW